MVTVNIFISLGTAIVNGMRGHISKLEREAITLELPDGRLIVLQPEIFQRFNPATKQVLATRKQFPLKLAFGLTIHKAQGTCKYISLSSNPPTCLKHFCVFLKLKVQFTSANLVWSFLIQYDLIDIQVTHSKMSIID